MKDINARLLLLEERFKDDPLIVEAENPETGEKITLPLREMLEKNYCFCKVSGGSSVKDLDKILEQLKQTAYAVED